jgi:hypothetical protein
MDRDSQQDKLNDLLLDMPALQPPPGVKSNFNDPPNHRAMSLGILITCMVTTTLITLTRLYVQMFIVGKLAVEDCRFLSKAVYTMHTC